MNAALKIQSSLNRQHAKAARAGKIADVEFVVQYASCSEVKCVLEENTRKLFACRLARERALRVRLSVEKSGDSHCPWIIERQEVRDAC